MRSWWLLYSLDAHTAGILQYISIQFEILTNQEAPITGIHCKMPTVSHRRLQSSLWCPGFSSVKPWPLAWLSLPHPQSVSPGLMISVF